MTAKIFELKPRLRSDAERLADVLGRKWLHILPRGALATVKPKPKPKPEPRVVTEGRKRALRALKP
jgi:hypothetical protein